MDKLKFVLIYCYQSLLKDLRERRTSQMPKMRHCLSEDRAHIILTDSKC